MMNELNDLVFYLKNAKYFNELWHKKMEQLLSEPDVSDAQQALMSATVQMYLAQKTDCQLTALRMAYDKAMADGRDYETCGLTVAFDPNEKGVSGDGVYYGLYPVGQFSLACHIPKETLRAGLTTKECEFFNIK